MQHSEPYLRLHHKLKKTALRLSEWSKNMFSKAKIHLHAAHMVILRLDIAQEECLLSPEELDLRSRLKRRVISLAVLERARKSQCARIANLKDGDANTIFSTTASMLGGEKITSIGSRTHKVGSPTISKKRTSSITTLPRSWAEQARAALTLIGMSLISSRMTWMISVIPSPKMRFWQP